MHVSLFVLALNGKMGKYQSLSICKFGHYNGLNILYDALSMMLRDYYPGPKYFRDSVNNNF